MSVNIFINDLNNWINPFSKNYKESIKGFNDLQGKQKVLTVVASTFCGLAFVVGGFAAFRGIVTWLHSERNSTADKVDQTIKKANPFSAPHPAEKPTEFDYLSELPDELICSIISYSGEGALRNIGLTSKKLFQVSDELWKDLVERRFGSTVAAEFKQSRVEASWREIMVDLCQPFEITSKVLYSLGASLSGWGDKPELKKVRDSVQENNTEALKEALIIMESAGKCHELNSRYYGSTPLEITAERGNIENARLLIEYGAKDAIHGQDYASVDGVKGKSALFYAAVNGKVEMVKFLLEKGARPHLNLEWMGFNRPFLSTFIEGIPNEDVNILECLLLLIKAWKAQVGYKVVCEHADAVDAFKKAIERGYAKVANLLFAFGIRCDLSKDFNNIIYHVISSKNLEMIKFLHKRGLVDFRRDSLFITDQNKTLLHIVFALGADQILQYLIKEVKVPIDIRNAEGETYDVSGKKELEQNIRRAIANQLQHFTGFYDRDSGFNMESLKECLKYKVDLNIPIDSKGQTLLHLAVKHALNLRRNWENGTISLLLENGANPKIKNENGTTPLELALKVVSKAREDKWYFGGQENLLKAENLIKKMQGQE